MADIKQDNMRSERSIIDRTKRVIGKYGAPVGIAAAALFGGVKQADATVKGVDPISPDKIDSMLLSPTNSPERQEVGQTIPVPIDTAYLQNEVNFSSPDALNQLLLDPSVQIVLQSAGSVIEKIKISENSQRSNFEVAARSGIINGINGFATIITETRPDGTRTNYVYDSANGEIVPVTLNAIDATVDLYVYHNQTEDGQIDRIVLGAENKRGFWILVKDQITEESTFEQRDRSDFENTQEIDNVPPLVPGQVSGQVDLRAEPATEAPILATLTPTTPVLVADIEGQPGQTLWYPVIAEGQLGNVRSDLVNKLEPSLGVFQNVDVSQRLIYGLDENGDLVILTDLNSPENSSNALQTVAEIHPVDIDMTINLNLNPNDMRNRPVNMDRVIDIDPYPIIGENVKKFIESLNRDPNNFVGSVINVNFVATNEGVENYVSYVGVGLAFAFHVDRTILQNGAKQITVRIYSPGFPQYGSTPSSIIATEFIIAMQAAILGVNTPSELMMIRDFGGEDIYQDYNTLFGNQNAVPFDVSLAN